MAQWAISRVCVVSLLLLRDSVRLLPSVSAPMRPYTAGAGAPSGSTSGSSAASAGSSAASAAPAYASAAASETPDAAAAHRLSGTRLLCLIRDPQAQMCVCETQTLAADTEMVVHVCCCSQRCRLLLVLAQAATSAPSPSPGPCCESRRTECHHSVPLDSHLVEPPLV